MELIRNYIEGIFSGLPKTKEVIEMKLNMIDNMEEKYNTLMEEGKNENEAIGIVVAQFGSIDELKSELGIEEEKIENEGQQAVNLMELSSLKKEYYEFRKKYSLKTTIAIILFILSPLLLIVLDHSEFEIISYIIFFGMVAAGVGILVYINHIDANYKELLGMTSSENYEKNEKTWKKNSKYEAFSGILWVATTVIYLFIGFTFGLWHPGWIIFPLATVLQIYMEYKAKADFEEKNEKNNYCS